SFDAIVTADMQDIEDAIRYTGFFRVKSQRLKSLALHVKDTYGSIGEMVDIPTRQLRSGLLNVSGIGYIDYKIFEVLKPLSSFHHCLVRW
ncbi:MAG TPA: hypothetical protein VMW95_00215, partial [Desulfobacterales bacterium]|nr:hypothetical protein [Desulfobacterales bacterium]